MKNYFNNYQEAWKFVHSMVVSGYDYDKQAEACEAFRMINQACKEKDELEAKGATNDR